MPCCAAGQACKALCCLADDHPAAQQACASAIQPVISFLSSPDAAVRDQACQALACLTCDCHQNQTAAGEHGALKSLLQMLWKPCESAQQQQEVVHLLMAMLVLAVQVTHLRSLHPVLHACYLQLCFCLPLTCRVLRLQFCLSSHMAGMRCPLCT